MQAGVSRANCLRLLMNSPSKPSLICLELKCLLFVFFTWRILSSLNQVNKSRKVKYSSFQDTPQVNIKPLSRRHKNFFRFPNFVIYWHLARGNHSMANLRQGLHYTMLNLSFVDCRFRASLVSSQPRHISPQSNHTGVIILHVFSSEICYMQLYVRDLIRLKWTWID